MRDKTEDQYTRETNGEEKQRLGNGMRRERKEGNDDNYSKKIGKTFKGKKEHIRI